MLISQKSRQTVDSCRFCWMCRHICPIGNATGQERNNARARALSVSMVLRGSAELSDSVMDNIYECALCGACTKECVTGWDPVAAFREVRLQAALDGKTPAYITKMIENIRESGNPYGEVEADAELKQEITSLPETTDTLLFLGQDARLRVPQAALNAIRLLKKCGVSFTVLRQEPDSGSALDFLVGAAEETRQAMKNAGEKLARFRTVVAFDPADAKVFERNYREWEIPLSAEVKSFPVFLAELLDQGKLPVKRLAETAAFQDPAALARDLGETEEARRVISACAQPKEMLLHGKDTVWAGNLLMGEYLPEVMKKTAARRWQDALASGAQALVTASPSEYAVLLAEKPEGMELLSLEELALSAL